MKKRMLSLFLVLVCVLASVGFSVSADEPTYADAIMGDVDFDFEITIQDYMIVRLALLDAYELSELQTACADVSGNGEVDLSDYMLLRLHILGAYTVEGKPMDPSGNITADLIADKTDAASMAANTKELQRCVDAVYEAGGGTVYLPAGTFHFSTQGMNARQYEDYVCMPRDNVTIVGAGEDTVLKPVGTTKGGLDMFYFNEYADSGFKNPKYLVNADFYDFVIDGELAHARTYTSAGKGFMINLYRDCDFVNIVVKNTDGTGFGMDCPINCTIRNCQAYNCGKAATTDNAGASGFGIGTGYCNEESILIDNCHAEGNRKFGIFFEHQGRFTPTAYTATSLENLLVTNCTAKNNYIDFGGELAVDVTYRNCTVLEGSTAVSWIAFKHYSIRCTVEDMHVEAKFSDVSDPTASCYDAVYWAVNQGLTTGTEQGVFGIGGTLTNAQALTFLYRLAGLPGELTLSRTAEETYYQEALKWAVKQELCSAETDVNETCTQAHLLTMLWKYAGSPDTDAESWAVASGIADGMYDTPLERGEAVTVLYNYFKNN